MTKILKATLLFVTICVQSLSAFEIGDIPLQDEGRIKPLDTFARNHLLAFYGKRSIKELDMGATDWIINLILNPENGRDQKIFNIRNPEVASSLFLDWTNEHKYSFNQITPGLSEQSSMLEMIDQKDASDRTVYEKQLYEISRNILRFEEISYLKALKFIPPSNNSESGEWLSPFDFILKGIPANENQEAILNSLQMYLANRLAGNDLEMSSALNRYEMALSTFQGINVKVDNLKKETWMNRVNLFYISLGLYLLSFIFLSISWMIKPILLNRVAYLLLISGTVIHGYGIFLRMQIMERPPVTTLYESVIFVSLIIMALAVLLEYFRKDGLGIFVGSVSGSVLHYVGFSYAADGDTLGMLVAVLNSNFWLATHVTTITIGYGASLMAGCVGHLYLIQEIRGVNSASLKSIFNNLFGITLLALFFTLFGTILGGIWADQSWGRFWGWDPKENGALLIVLWQLMMIHMRLSGLAKPKEFALGMALNNIIVALAWFGVNLLQVGLHSYGFDDGVARNLFMFIGFEIIFCLGTYYWPSLRVKLRS
jgi:ABC-type transport system involved in cytochrome c biogenesis permease subunit|tara:strand:- start:1148 stop:2770 length:1623 start_codon:yes stop_codon:yes gene_type:complete